MNSDYWIWTSPSSDIHRIQSPYNMHIELTSHQKTVVPDSCTLSLNGNSKPSQSNQVHPMIDHSWDSIHWNISHQHHGMDWTWMTSSSSPLSSRFHAQSYLEEPNPQPLYLTPDLQNLIPSTQCCSMDAQFHSKYICQPMTCTRRFLTIHVPCCWFPKIACWTRLACLFRSILNSIPQQ